MMHPEITEHEMAGAIEKDLKDVATLPAQESKAESDAETMAEFMRRRAETHERNIVERRKAIKSKVDSIQLQIQRLADQQIKLREDEKRDNASDEKIANACRAALKIIEGN